MPNEKYRSQWHPYKDIGFSILKSPDVLNKYAKHLSLILTYTNYIFPLKAEIPAANQSSF